MPRIEAKPTYHGSPRALTLAELALTSPSGPACRWPQNARLWVYVNGSYSRLTLAPDQTLVHDTGRLPAEEGWYRLTQAWWFDADAAAVRLTTVDDGRDCDGRLTRYHRSQAQVSRLQVHGFSDQPEVFPDWQHVDASQRDYNAEAMGY